LCTDEWRATLFGKRVLVVHGDLVTGDIWYRMLHTVLRSPVLTGINALIPDEVSLRIGLGMSHYSRVRDRDAEILINRKILDHAATLEDVDVFITGHTHIPFDETIEGKTGPIRVINLGDWVTNFSYLWVENGSWELRRA
jgi:UDP-2,3-diacylglucosamine pyrophosphatase LpxH